MRSKKLPFNIQLNRKYNDINVDNFLQDWWETKDNRRERIICMDDELHLEMGKFSTYDIDINEVIDIGLRYALSKKEFRDMLAQIIDEKKVFRLNPGNSNEIFL
ncbi:MAG: hypothetical protein Q4G08_09780 [Capnocytophaga sp.]|nr:hypothetical protein [Capnocytophaga sp.]